MSDRHIIRGISFDADSGGYVIEYLTPARDIRATGLVLNHALLIPAEDPFIDLLEDLESSVQRALNAGLALHADGEPLPLVEDPDDSSPYDNPVER